MYPVKGGQTQKQTQHYPPPPSQKCWQIRGYEIASETIFGLEVLVVLEISLAQLNNQRFIGDLRLSCVVCRLFIYNSRTATMSPQLQKRKIYGVLSNGFQEGTTVSRTSLASQTSPFHSFHAEGQRESPPDGKIT